MKHIGAHFKEVEAATPHRVSRSHAGQHPPHVAERVEAASVAFPAQWFQGESKGVLHVAHGCAQGASWRQTACPSCPHHHALAPALLDSPLPNSPVVWPLIVPPHSEADCGALADGQRAQATHKALLVPLALRLVAWGRAVPRPAGCKAGGTAPSCSRLLRLPPGAPCPRAATRSTATPWHPTIPPTSIAVM